MSQPNDYEEVVDFTKEKHKRQTKRNRDNEERMKRERDDDNQKVLRKYGIKPKKWKSQDHE